MKMAFANNECPFCGGAAISGSLSKVRDEISSMIDEGGKDNSHDVANRIVAEYIIQYLDTPPPSRPSRPVLEPSISSRVEVPPPEQLADVEEEEEPDLSYMSDEERAQAEEDWKLMQEGNSEAFFDASDDAPAPRQVSHPAPPAPPQADVRSLQSSVQRAHQKSSGDIPEGFEDPSLLPQKGLGRLQRL